MGNQNTRTIKLFTIALLLGVLMTIYSEGEICNLYPKDASCNGIEIKENGEAVLAPDCDWGQCLWEIKPESRMQIEKILPEVSIETSSLLVPPGDVIIQIRCWKIGGAWSSWFPENLLAGGDFQDKNNSGLPDLADILEITTQTLMRTDLPSSAHPKWVQKHVSLAVPPLVATMDQKPVFMVPKPWEQGQTVVQMRLDRIPPTPAITISGWNGWDLGENHTMGLMSRFHEIDTIGNRLNKIMFIGDDDFNQRGGVSPLKWRAVSFSPRNETRRLNLYPMRLISSAGTIMASQYQLREDSLADSPFRGASILCPDLKNSAIWVVDDPGLVDFDQDGVEIRPKPLTNAFILSPKFEIPPVERIALSVEMEATVPERYNDCDPSHKAWMSTYLEFLDDAEKVVEVLQVTACRPRLGDVLITAGERPKGSRRARLRLVASHKTYLGKEDEKNMDGVMICRWRNLEMFESLYPQTYRERLDREPLSSGEIPPSKKYQIRAILLSDRKTPSPVLKSVKGIMKR
jgi:hypothetical protein